MSQTSVDSVNEIDLREPCRVRMPAGRCQTLMVTAGPTLRGGSSKRCASGCSSPWSLRAFSTPGSGHQLSGQAPCAHHRSGDLVITVNKDIVEPKVGSIIVATPPVGGCDLPAIAHRIIEIKT